MYVTRSLQTESGGQKNDFPWHNFTTMCHDTLRSGKASRQQFVLLFFEVPAVNTGLFEMIVGGLTTCHTQYTWGRSMCIFLFNRATLKVFVTYLIGALYVQPLWFYKHQHDNPVRSKLFVVCQRWWFQWRFCLYNHKRCTYRAPIRYVTKTWSVAVLKKNTYNPIWSVLCMTGC